MHVQPLGVMENREGMQDNSSTRTRDESQLEERGETIHASRDSRTPKKHEVCLQFLPGRDL